MQIRTEDLQNKFELERQKLMHGEAEWERERHSLQTRVEQLEMQIRLHELTPPVPPEQSPVLSSRPPDTRQSAEFKHIFGTFLLKHMYIYSTVLVKLRVYLQYGSTSTHCSIHATLTLIVLVPSY